MMAHGFEIKRLEIPKYELELTLQKEYRDELVVKADILTVHLSQFRAVLTQKEAKPFSRRDLKLREGSRDISSK
jgi:hypothetical protein